ncbi:4593_t:CDS:2, partial [Entrophospora sp. SA101]
IDHTQDLVRIVFCINGGIIILEISKYTSKFYLNENEGGISFTEFLYQILQAYDFWYLYHKHNCTIQ